MLAYERLISLGISVRHTRTAEFVLGLISVGSEEQGNPGDGRLLYSVQCNVWETLLIADIYSVPLMRHALASVLGRDT